MLAVTSAVASGLTDRCVVTVLAAVKAGIEGIEVFAVQLILSETQGFTETGGLK